MYPAYLEDSKGELERFGEFEDEEEFHIFKGQLLERVLNSKNWLMKHGIGFCNPDIGQAIKALYLEYRSPEGVNLRAYARSLRQERLGVLNKSRG